MRGVNLAGAGAGAGAVVAGADFRNAARAVAEPADRSGFAPSWKSTVRNCAGDAPAGPPL